MASRQAADRPGSESGLTRRSPQRGPHEVRRRRRFRGSPTRSFPLLFARWGTASVDLALKGKQAGGMRNLIWLGSSALFVSLFATADGP